MSSRTLTVDDALYDYLLSKTVREPELLKQLRAETAELPMARMQISPEQGQFMTLLVQMLGARRTIEVGVFTGYSALATALALPSDGKIVACDTSDEWTQIGRRYWAKAGIAHKIELRLAPATQTLSELIDAGERQTFDFAFIDADKENYPQYYEQCLELLRPGGVIAVDNMLWGGSVADPANQSETTQAIRALNDKVYRDDRVSMSLVPIGDGLLLALKR